MEKHFAIFISIGPEKNAYKEWKKKKKQMKFLNGLWIKLSFCVLMKVHALDANKDGKEMLVPCNPPLYSE